MVDRKREQRNQDSIGQTQFIETAHPREDLFGTFSKKNLASQDRILPNHLDDLSRSKELDDYLSKSKNNTIFQLDGQLSPSAGKSD